MTLRPGPNPIPEPVLNLQIRVLDDKRIRLDAVVVVEHRNVLEVMAEGKHAVEHVIVIMVGTPQN